MKGIQLTASNCLAVILTIALFAGGCAPIQPRYPSTRPQVPQDTREPQHTEQYKPVTGKGGALFRQAQSAQQTGKYAEAEMLLERALRIEPQNPHYWYAMAQAKYQQGQYPQSIQFCLKAESLAGSQPQVAAESRSLLRRAQTAMANK